MSTTAPAALVIGTHTWSPDNYDKAKSIVEVARQHGISVLDTARSYVGFYQMSLQVHALLTSLRRVAESQKWSWAAWVYIRTFSLI